MSPETINFIVGWLAGLISTSITLLIGHWIQLSTERRQRKHTITSRRLDQAEQSADLILGVVHEIYRYMAYPKGRTESVDPMIRKVMDNMANIYSSLVVNDGKLSNIYERIGDLMDAQLKLLEEYDETNNQQDSISKQRDLNHKFGELHIELKQRIDALRAEDPDFYLKEL